MTANPSHSNPRTSSVSNIAWRVVAFLFSLLLAGYIAAKASALHEWMSWRSDGGLPIVMTGFISHIAELKGKDKGSQFVYIQSEPGRKRLNAYFSSSLVHRLKRQGDSKTYEASYFPTASGLKLIYRLVDLGSGEIFYDGQLRNDAWPGLAAGILIALFTSIFLLLLGVATGYLKADTT